MNKQDLAQVKAVFPNAVLKSSVIWVGEYWIDESNINPWYEIGRRGRGCIDNGYTLDIAINNLAKYI